MKYNVAIKNKSYVVEIEDINARPVIAHVEGQRFEVIPDIDPVGSAGKPEPILQTQQKTKKKPRKLNHLICASLIRISITAN